MVIRVENLGKLYHIGEKAPYKTLREAINNIFTSSLKKLKNGLKVKEQALNYIWALKDVSFEIKKGEAVGIIGRNGAGKSTLLKILSRITPPTEGYVEVQGRMASLLEVGTGFHPELTGRDNIYLSGVILGMKKAEIKQKFDEIVAFAEIEKFIDTPVKHYSSGMYVRLAFAVAAHLEPEILLVDEVLAVGDIEFQKKCLGKMGNVAEEGRTVLFVSHNLQAVSRLCSRAILLNEGMLLKEGPTHEMLNAYIAMTTEVSNIKGDLNSPKLRFAASRPDSLFKWTHIILLNSQKQSTSELRFREPFEIIFRGCATKKCEKVLVGLGIYSKIAEYIFSTHQIYNGLSDTLPEGTSEFHVEINPNILAPGYYEIQIGAVGPGVEDHIRVALEFDILELGISHDKSWHTPHQVGVVDYPCKWSVEHTT